MGRSEFARAMSKVRKFQGLTQSAAADAAGFDFWRWQRIETGRIEPTVEECARIVRVLPLLQAALISAADHRGSSFDAKRCQRGSE